MAKGHNGNSPCLLPNTLMLLMTERPKFRDSRPAHPRRPFSALLVQLHFKRQRLADDGWPSAARESGHLHEELLFTMLRGIGEASGSERHRGRVLPFVPKPLICRDGKTSSH